MSWLFLCSQINKLKSNFKTRKISFLRTGGWQKVFKQQSFALPPLNVSWLKMCFNHMNEDLLFHHINGRVPVWRKNHEILNFLVLEWFGSVGKWQWYRSEDCLYVPILNFYCFLWLFHQLARYVADHLFSFSRPFFQMKIPSSKQNNSPPHQISLAKN